MFLAASEISGTLCAARHKNFTGADNFDNSKFLQHAHQRINLVGITDHLKHNGLIGEIDGLAAEVLGNLQRFTAAFRPDRNFD